MSAPYLKFWLDDERRPPDSTWVWFDSAEVLLSTIDSLHKIVKVISLDHDLGDKAIYGDGYEVVEQIEAWVFQRPDFHCPLISIHSANPVGRQKMEQGVKSIERRISKSVLLR